MVKESYPNRLCDKFERLKKPHDPEHISKIINRLILKLKPKTEEEEW